MYILHALKGLAESSKSSSGTSWLIGVVRHRSDFPKKPRKRLAFLSVPVHCGSRLAGRVLGILSSEASLWVEPVPRTAKSLLGEFVILWTQNVWVRQWSPD